MPYKVLWLNGGEVLWWSGGMYFDELVGPDGGIAPVAWTPEELIGTRFSSIAALCLIRWLKRRGIEAFAIPDGDTRSDD